MQQAIRSSSTEPHQAATLLQSLLQQSRAKIFLLCGARAENALHKLLSTRLGQCRTLVLRGLSYKFYAEEQIKKGSFRLYLRCPQLSMVPGSASSQDSIRLAEVIKFAVNLMGTVGIRPYFVESSSILGLILARLRKGRLGEAPLMTFDTIDPVLRFWLAREGFTDDEDVRKLEELAGSLTRGLLAMLHALAKLSRSRLGHKPHKHFRERRNEGGPRVRAHEPSDPQTHQEIGQFVTQVLAPRELQIREHLLNQSKPKDSSPSKENATRKSILEELGLENFPRADMNDSTLGEDISKRIESNVRDGTTMHPEEEASLDDLVEFTMPQPSNDETDGQMQRQRKAIDRSQQVNRKTGRSGVSSWRAQRVRYRDREYTYTVPRGTTYLGRIHIRSCPIDIPSEADIADGSIHVSIEISEQGSRHPNVYATAARNEDPASRLAFRCRYRNSSEEDIIAYYTNPNKSQFICRCIGRQRIGRSHLANSQEICGKEQRQGRVVYKSVG